MQGVRFTILGQKNNTKWNKWKWRIAHFTQDTQWILDAKGREDWMTDFVDPASNPVLEKFPRMPLFPVECNSEEEKATSEADGMPGEKELMGLSLQMTLGCGWTVAAEMYNI